MAAFFQSNAMKQLKKVLKERGPTDPESQKSMEKAVKHLSKRCNGRRALESLSYAVNTKSKHSECVIVNRVPEKNRATEIDKGNTHILTTQLFRFGWLQSVNDIKSVTNCTHPFSRRAETYCINPYHYELPKAKVAVVTVQRDRFPFPENGFEDLPEDDYIPNMTLSPDNPLIVRRHEGDDEEMGSPESNFSEDVEMEEVTVITEDPKRPGLFAVPFEETECWLKLSYGEGDSIKWPNIEVKGHEYTIDSSTTPTSIERLCLGYATGSDNNSRDKKIEEIRRAIGRGTRLYHTGGEVYIECLSDHPIFVQCPAANRRYGMSAASVIKVDPNTTLKILNYSEFSNELSQAVERGYTAVYALTKLCTLRASFVKGWGHEYSRKTINQTGCWFIAQFPAPALWIERCIEKMGAPPLFCGSVT